MRYLIAGHCYNNIKNGGRIMGRDRFIFYRSFFEAIEIARVELKASSDDIAQIYTAITNYALNEEEPQGLKGIPALIWKQTSQLLKTNWAKYKGGKGQGCNGIKGGNPNFETGKRNPYYPVDNPIDNPQGIKVKRNKGNNEDNSNQRLERKNSSSVLPTLAQKDYVFVMDLWNDVCTRLRKTTKLTSKNSGGKRSDRKGAIRYCLNFLAQNFTENKTLDEANTLLRTAFEKVNASNFLCGDGGRGWKANFDWVMRDDSLVKILEGNYDNGKYKITGADTRRANEEWG